MSKRLSRSTEGEDGAGEAEQVGAVEQKKVERRGRKPKNTAEPLTPKKARPSKSSQKQRRTHRHRHNSDKKHHSGSGSSSASSSSSSESDGSRSSGSSGSSSSSSSYDSEGINSSDESSSSSSGSSGHGSSSSDTSSSDSGSERKKSRNRKKSRAGNKGSKDAANSDDDGDDEEEVYCVCKKPYHHEFMFMCDRCQNWFHPKCVGLTKAEIKAHPDSQYYCTACRSALRPSSGAATAAAASASSGAPQQRTGKESTAATREQLSAAFTRLLELCASARGGDSEVFSTTARAHARKLGTELEAALYERSGKNTTGAVYVARARFLLHNLDPKTTTLGKRVLSGELAPAVVALTDPRTLATKHIALPPSLTTPVPHVVPLPSTTPPEHKPL